MKSNISVIVKVSIFALILSLFCFFSHCTWFDAEDMHHMQARSIQEGINYAWFSYTDWNSRIGEMLAYVTWSTHGLASCYQQTICDIIHPFICVCGIILVIRIGVGRGNVKNYVSLFLFVSLCFIGSKQNWFWFIGNMNWLYPCITTMLFFVIWEGIFQGKFKVRSWRFLLSIPFAVVVGMSNENTSLVSLFVFLVVACTHAFGKRRFAFHGSMLL